MLSLFDVVVVCRAALVRRRRRPMSTTTWTSQRRRGRLTPEVRVPSTERVCRVGDVVDRAVRAVLASSWRCSAVSASAYRSASAVTWASPCCRWPATWRSGTPSARSCQAQTSPSNWSVLDFVVFKKRFLCYKGRESSKKSGNSAVQKSLKKFEIHKVSG